MKVDTHQMSPTSLNRLIGSRYLKLPLPILAIIFLMLAFIRPFLVDKYIHTGDAHYHLYRLIALDHAVRQGEIWPRFVPGLMFGYGVPLFNYFPPTSLYPLEILHLSGLSFLHSLLLGLALYAILGAFGAYMLGKEWGGPLMGIGTVVAFVYSPYYVVHWMDTASVGQVAATALMPWVLWAFRRLAVRGGRWNWVASVVLLSAVILIHNITAMLLVGLLIPYCLYLIWTNDDRRRALFSIALAGILAIALAAIFWLPALTELEYVHLDRGMIQDLNFRANFRTLAQIFEPTGPRDPNWYHEPPIALGWPQLLLGAVAFGILLWKRDQHQALRGWLLIALGMLVCLIFLTTYASVWLWENLPLLSRIQQPGRLLGQATLLLAMIAGAGVMLVGEQLRDPAVQRTWVGVVSAAMILYVVPIMYIRYAPSKPPAESIVDVFSFESQPPYYVGAATKAEYVSRWVDSYSESLAPLYAENEVIPRLIWNPDITVHTEEWELLRGKITYSTDKPVNLIFRWAYFPGWKATLDGKAVPITPTDETGLLSVPAEAGEHTLEVRFGLTPVRRLATWISLLALGVSLLLVGMRLPLWKPPSDSATASSMRLDLLWVTMAVGLIAFGARVWLVDPELTPLNRPRFTHSVEAGPGPPVLATFGGRVTLLAYDLSREAVPSGGSTLISTYWQRIPTGADHDLLMLLSLRNSAAETVLEIPLTARDNDDQLPVPFWPESYYIRRQTPVALLPGLPPGTYSMHVRVQDPETGQNLEAQDEAGVPLTQYARIGELEITRPMFPVSVASMGLDMHIEAPLSDAISLVDVEPLTSSREVGQPMVLRLGWRADRAPGATYHARISWLDANGETAATTNFPPIADYSTELWRARDVWLGIHSLVVPGRLETGTYDLALEIINPAGEPQGDAAVIGSIEIEAPVRTFDEPDMDHMVDLEWENSITLLGFDVEAEIPAGNALNLMLYWQPQTDINHFLTVFVHLIDDQDQIVAQQDQIPVGGARPTVGWAPGEIVSDGYVLSVGADVPPGNYRLRLGWYDARSGSRIPLADGSEFALLPVEVVIRASQ